MNPVHAHASHFPALSTQYTFLAAYPADGFIKKEMLRKNEVSGNAVKSSC